MKPHTPEWKDSPGIETRDKLKDVYHTCKSKGATNMRRREERREERRGGAEKTHYQMREKLVSIGDDFWIENNRGEKVYKVDGKALRVRQTMIFEDRSGRELAKIQERMLRVKDSMEVEDPSGRQIAMVKKALITPVRDRWTVKIKGGPDLEVQGNILDHEYTIGEGRDKVAEVSKKWFRVRDTYGVEIEPGQDDILILAVTACIDQMAH
ncbi:MAG: LURP-one-related/scramblase family protein [Ktedonobacteraceae bacterium]